MKKILCFIILLFSFNLSVKASKLEVTLNKCVDGDTAWFNLEDDVIKVRFLAIDTPESTTKKEPFGKEASEFTCNTLKNSRKIEIEYDPGSDKFDKYDRHLVWVFTDNELLQNKIIQNGLAEVKYIYGDYLYTDILEKSLNEAKNQGLGMWENNDQTNYSYFIIIIIAIIIICLFSSSTRNKVIKNSKKEIKKSIKKILKKY